MQLNHEELAALIRLNAGRSDTIAIKFGPSGLYTDSEQTKSDLMDLRDEIELARHHEAFCITPPTPSTAQEK